jgi:hypothetical protein
MTEEGLWCLREFKRTMMNDENSRVSCKKSEKVVESSGAICILLKITGRKSEKLKIISNVGVLKPT